jgi:hypothetical protein
VAFVDSLGACVAKDRLEVGYVDRIVWKEVDLGTIEEYGRPEGRMIVCYEVVS